MASPDPMSTRDEAPPAAVGKGPGVLYFDPNPTTARLATAGLRLAGYVVFVARTQEEAVTLCRAHGPGGDGSVIALLLDTATAPELSASVLRALVGVPGAAELPGILLVSRVNPTPIAGAESLPTLKRPFTTPALLKIVRESIDRGPPGGDQRTRRTGEDYLARIELTLSEAFPDLSPTREQLTEVASALVNHADIETPPPGVGLQVDLATARLESALHVLDIDGARGVVEIRREETVARLHIDRGRIRAAELENTEEDLRFGRFVVEAAFMENHALEAAAAKKDPQHRLLGQRLVDEGLLRRAELNQVLINQGLEITCHVLTWRRGTATFSPVDEMHPLAKAAGGRAELRIADALLEGLRRVEQTAEMGPQMPGVDDIYIRHDGHVAARGREGFTRDELGVLELLNGRNSIKDIARKTRSGTFSVATVLHRLARADLVRRLSMPVPA